MITLGVHLPWKYVEYLKKICTPVDKSKSEDEDADKLDAEALKEKLEKRFNR